MGPGAPHGALLLRVRRVREQEVARAALGARDPPLLLRVLVSPQGQQGQDQGRPGGDPLGVTEDKQGL